MVKKTASTAKGSTAKERGGAAAAAALPPTDSRPAAAAAAAAVAAATASNSSIALGEGAEGALSSQSLLASASATESTAATAAAAALVKKEEAEDEKKNVVVSAGALPLSASPAATAATSGSASTNNNTTNATTVTSNSTEKKNQQRSRHGMARGTRRPVVYIQDDDLCEYDFSLLIQQHAMKPYRFLATHELVEALGLHDYMRVIRKVPVLRPENLLLFHDPHYISNVVQHSERAWEWHPDSSLVGFTGDCPPMEGLMEYSCGVVAASLTGACLLNAQETDIAINWQGGMHHAKCGECSGFCYFNDIVIAILELLKAPQHERVLYIDLDVHHGDGVEEAFIATDRVFTLSLHKFGENFFPGTGHPLDLGFKKGKNCTLNVPVWDNINDLHYTTLFEKALNGIIENFQPNAIVLQCGADSLAGDRVGTLNVSSIGHSTCVGMVAALGLPLLVVGGGGYSVKNVARLWAAETAVLCGAPIPPNTPLPFTNLPLTGWLYEGTNGTLLVPSNNCGYSTTASAVAGNSMTNAGPSSSAVVGGTGSVVIVSNVVGHPDVGSGATTAASAAAGGAAAASPNGGANAAAANGAGGEVGSPLSAAAQQSAASATGPIGAGGVGGGGFMSIATASILEANTPNSLYSLAAQHAHVVNPAAGGSNAEAVAERRRDNNNEDDDDEDDVAAPATTEVIATVHSSLTSFYTFLTPKAAHLLTFGDQLQIMLKFIEDRVAMIPLPHSSTAAAPKGGQRAE